MLSAMKTVTERYWHLIHDVKEGGVPCAKACAAAHDAAMKARVHADFKRWSDMPNQSMVSVHHLHWIADAGAR